MASDGSIVIDTQLDSSGLKRGVSKLKGETSGLTSALKGVAKAAVVAFSVQRVVDFGKACIDLGSSIAEVQNVVDTAFGEMSYKIEQFAESSIENFGISKLSAKKTASTYMAMARGMNINEEAASDMAISLTALTGDVASFYNISQELADTKLKSIFTGETETLKDLGVVMTQTNLDAYALANGYGKTTDAMSQAELVALRYAYVTNQLRLASGDFVKTQDSWANQTRILSEQWNEFMAVLGQGLIQVLTPVVKVLNEILSTLIQIVSGISEAIGGLFGKVEADTDSAADSISNAVSSQNDLTEAIEETGKAQKKSMAGFDTLNVLSSNSNQSSTSGEAAALNIQPIDIPVETDTAEKSVSQFAEYIKNALSGIKNYITTQFGPSLSAWGNAFAGLKTPFDEMASRVSVAANSLWANTLKPFAQKVTNEFVPSIVNAYSENMAPVFEDVASFAMVEFAKDFEFACQQVDRAVKDIISPAMNLFQKVFTDVFDSIGRKWSEVGEGLLKKFSEFRDTFKAIWNNLYEKIFKPVIDHVFEVLNWLWDDHLKPLWDNILDFFASLADCIMTVWNNWLAPLVNWLVSILGPLVVGVINTIIDVVGTIVGVIADALGGIFRALGGLLDFITGVFSGDWEKAWQGICDFFGGIWDAIWGVIKGVINLIIDGINLLWRAIYGVFAGIVNGIGGAVGWIGSLLGQEWEFSMPSDPPTIPKLAQGAVIPPNREFLAVLGDQKSGTNIEAPLSTIEQALDNVLSRRGNDGGETVIRFEGTMGQLIRAMRPYIDNDERLRGKRLVMNAT